MFEERYDIDLDDSAFTDRLRHSGVSVVQVMQIVHGRYLARRHIGATVNLYGPTVDAAGETTWIAVAAIETERDNVWRVTAARVLDPDEISTLRKLTGYEEGQ